MYNYVGHKLHVHVHDVYIYEYGQATVAGYMYMCMHIN